MEVTYRIKEKEEENKLNILFSKRTPSENIGPPCRRIIRKKKQGQKNFPILILIHVLCIFYYNQQLFF